LLFLTEIAKNINSIFFNIFIFVIGVNALIGLALIYHFYKYGTSNDKTRIMSSLYIAGFIILTIIALIALNRLPEETSLGLEKFIKLINPL